MTIINVTKLLEERRANPHPCDGCMDATSTTTQWTDPDTGDLMQEDTSCRDHCERLAVKEAEKRLGDHYLGNKL